MKKIYLTPNTKIEAAYQKFSILTGSISNNGDGTNSGNHLGGDGGDETWGGEFDAKNRFGSFGYDD